MTEENVNPGSQIWLPLTIFVRLNDFINGSLYQGHRVNTVS